MHSCGFTYRFVRISYVCKFDHGDITKLILSMHYWLNGQSQYKECSVIRESNAFALLNKTEQSIFFINNLHTMNTAHIYISLKNFNFQT